MAFPDTLSASQESSSTNTTEFSPSGDATTTSGSVLELGETFEQGVQCEVLEETGIHVRVERLTGVYKNMKLGVVALVFRCTPISGTSHTTDESCEVRWLDLADAVARMPPTFTIRVQDASLPTAAHRIHDGTTGMNPA